MIRTPLSPSPDRPFSCLSWLAILILASVFALGPGASVLTGANPVQDRSPLPREALEPTRLELVESYPLETTLGHADIRDAADVWVELITNARQSIDFAEFYLSDDPAGGGRLRNVVQAVQAAARRGVHVRFLIDNGFYKTYPALADSLGRQAGISVRRLDTKAWSDGVMHAKYFIVDRDTVYFGSQNFDWRSLDHIQELGVVVRGVACQPYNDVFSLDWDLAGALPPGKYTRGPVAAALVDSVQARHRVLDWRAEYALRTEGPPGIVSPVASPAGRLPNPGLWDEPRLLELLDAARDSVAVQVLSYSSATRDSTRYDPLDAALRRAAGRGVRVRLIVSEWSKSKSKIGVLQSLARVPNLEVRFIDIPQWSGGFIPFARTVHAKYLTVDGHAAWIGTSNWERDYFHESRNVGLIAADPWLARRLAAFFNDDWNSTYAERVDPGKSYTPPRVAK